MGFWVYTSPHPFPQGGEGVQLLSCFVETQDFASLRFENNLLLCDEFQTDDGSYEGEKEENSPKIVGFFEEENADENGPNSSNARPYCIRCSHWDCLSGNTEQIKAHATRNKKTQ